MNIGVDGYEANVLKRVGIGQYAYQLLCTLARVDRHNSYTVFLPSAPLPDMPPQTDKWHYIVGKPGAFWTAVQLPRLIAKINLDVFFTPTHYAPWFAHVPKIISIMDLSYLHFPRMFRFSDLVKLKYMGFLSVKSTAKILTISEFSKKEIGEHYHRAADDIIVAYPGRTVFTQHKLRNAAKKYALPQKFILFVGTLQPRKNIQNLIAAYELLPDPDVQLVLVGKKGWLYGPILERIEKSAKTGQIEVRDFVDDEELAVLYRQAACFTLPSLYEGFGMPVVAALQMGCPVVVSNSTSLPEAAGQAGIYVDPENAADIARGLKKALQLPKKEREQLVKTGLTHIKKFTWENCAGTVMKVFTTVQRKYKL